MERQIDAKLDRKYQGDVDQTQLKSFHLETQDERWKSQMVLVAAILKMYFELFFLNRKTNWFETW